MILPEAGYCNPSPCGRAQGSEGIDDDVDWFAPIFADAAFGGPLNAFELMKSMIAAGVHWEDQLASEKKCGHLGGKVLIPTSQHVRTPNRGGFLPGWQRHRSVHRARRLAYAPHSDLLWMETSKPDLEVARAFTEAIKAEYPDQTPVHRPRQHSP